MIMPVFAVENITASIDFYTNKLGFNLTFSIPGPDGNIAFAFVNLGQNLNIGLSQQPGLSSKGRGAVMMCYVPDETNLDQYYETVVANGVTIDTPIADQYWGDRTFQLTDPDGFELQFAKTVKQFDLAEVEAHMHGSGS